MDNFFCRVLLACIHRISYRRFWLRGSRRGGAPSERKNGQAPEQAFTGPARICPLRRHALALGYRSSFGLGWVGIAALPARNMSQAYCQGTQRSTARAATQVRDKGPVGGVVTLGHGTGAELAEELAEERACAHVYRSVPYPDDTS